MAEKEPSAGFKAEAHLDRRLTRDRVHVTSDYDAHLREYEVALAREGHQEKSASLVRAKLDVEIARDMAANILSLENATERGEAEANALSRRVYWLNWTLVVLTAVLVLVGVGGIYAAWWFWAHP